MPISRRPPAAAGVVLPPNALRRRWVPVRAQIGLVPRGGGEDLDRLDSGGCPRRLRRWWAGRCVTRSVQQLGVAGIRHSPPEDVVRSTVEATAKGLTAKHLVAGRAQRLGPTGRGRVSMPPTNLDGILPVEWPPVHGILGCRPALRWQPPRGQPHAVSVHEIDVVVVSAQSVSNENEALIAPPVLDVIKMLEAKGTRRPTNGSVARVARHPISAYR